MQKLESVQRTATRFTVNDNVCSYEARLAELDLLPLSMCRDFLDLSFVYNCFNGFVDFNIDKYVALSWETGLEHIMIP